MKVKWLWHCHHKVLVEPQTEPIKNRIKYIKIWKPDHEVKLRLKLLKDVKGDIPKSIIKAWDACKKAEATCNKARNVYVKGDVHKEAKDVRNEAWDAYVKARDVRNEVWDAYDKTINTSRKLKALHKKECGCDWDGKSIFKEK